jgi:ketosteroid isomerase-like protein
MDTSGTILKEFYAAIVSRDMARARSYLAEDMVYHGIFKDLPSADAYMAVFQSFMEFTTRLDVQLILSDGEDAAIFYEMETTKPARAVTFVGEWHRIRDGKIIWARAACDGRPFAALFPASSQADPSCPATMR